MKEILTPNCPLCNEPPALLLEDQAFCGNDACTAVMWRRDVTLDANLMSAQQLKLPGCEEGTLA